MIKTIVVGTDGSEHAQHAVAFTAELAAQLNAEVVLVHAAAPFPGPMAGYMPYVTQDALDESRKELERRARTEFSAPLSTAGLVWHSRVQDGSAPIVLGEVATEVGAQLIVVGTRDMHALGEFFLGSTSHALTHHAPVPVIVVPHAAAKAKPSPNVADPVASPV